MSDEWDDAELQIEIRPDGTVRFEVAGIAGEGCEALERLVVEALQGEVTERERTAAFYQPARASTLATRLRSLLKRS